MLLIQFFWNFVENFKLFLSIEPEHRDGTIQDIANTTREAASSFLVQFTWETSTRDSYPRISYKIGI
jgi:hypothetical protein